MIAIGFSPANQTAWFSQVDKVRIECILIPKKWAGKTYREEKVHYTFGWDTSRSKSRAVFRARKCDFNYTPCSIERVKIKYEYCGNKIISIQLMPLEKSGNGNLSFFVFITIFQEFGIRSDAIPLIRPTNTLFNNVVQLTRKQRNQTFFPNILYKSVQTLSGSSSGSNKSRLSAPNFARPWLTLIHNNPRRMYNKTSYQTNVVLRPFIWKTGTNLAHQSRDKMPAILQKIFSNTFREWKGMKFE